MNTGKIYKGAKNPWVFGFGCLLMSWTLFLNAAQLFGFLVHGGGILNGIREFGPGVVGLTISFPKAAEFLGLEYLINKIKG